MMNENDKDWMDILRWEEELPDHEPEAIPYNDQSDINDHDGHRYRLRRQVLADGFDSVSPQEILELILCYVQPRQDVKTVCEDLLDYYGDPRDLLKSNLEEFSRFEGLGEDGAQWLDAVCTLARICGGMKPENEWKISNFPQLRRVAGKILGGYKGPCCIQMLSDERDLLMYHHQICGDLRWGETPVLTDAADCAFAIRARNSYLILYTDDPLSHPDAYDLESMKSYALLLKYSRCTFRDVLIMNRQHCLSLRQMHKMDDLPKPARRIIDFSAAEEAMPMPEGGLIVHRTYENDLF